MVIACETAAHSVSFTSLHPPIHLYFFTVHAASTFKQELRSVTLPSFSKTNIMFTIHKLIPLILFALTGVAGNAQISISGKVIDADTKEPLAGVSIHCTDKDCTAACITNALGTFTIVCRDCTQLSFSSIGFNSVNIPVGQAAGTILLTPSNSILNTVVVTANRGEGVKRSQAPVAISTLNTKTIQDAKPTTIDQVLNKVSGVNMINLGNEQHQMSIRQPMTTKSLFLYLEDGIPVRTTGLFNHNALLEMNMTGVKTIEVIKGPSSSLYGSEAIGGVVNFISYAPSADPVLKLSTQGNNIGYKRADLQSGFITGRWGFALSGYYADKRNSFIEFTDFHKATATARVDYRINERINISNSLTWVNYYSDMPGGVDSTMFATRKFINPQTFTFRKVDAVRFHSTLNSRWNANSKTTASLIYRDNTIAQNPNYRIRDDYRKMGSVWTGKKQLAHGEVNESSFNSLAFIAQHRQSVHWKNAVIIGGINLDLSPSTYDAEYIRITKDTVTKKYTAYQLTDSMLSSYSTRINNYAAFGSFEFNPAEKLRVVASLRYDLFRYNFNNRLTLPAFSGSPDTLNNFSRISPKIGFTYSVTSRTGVYANYSQGFVPPQVTEMYTGVKVAALRPSVFSNYEVGGWAEIIKNKLSFDMSLYRLEGSNEVISVRLDDGSSENRNAGKTSHKGVELGLNASPVKNIVFRLSGAYSEHRFVQFVEKGNSYSGNEMNNAPRWTHNAELWYRPAFVKGLRIGAEWQKVGSYYMDARNSVKYEGYDVLNLRVGYAHKAFEVWVNVLNATNNYYSYISTKSTSYSYQLAEPRNFNVGISFDIAQLARK